MKQVLLGGQVGGLHLHKHISPQLNTEARHDKRLRVVYVLRNEKKFRSMNILNVSMSLADLIYGCM